MIMMRVGMIPEIVNVRPVVIIVRIVEREMIVIFWEEIPIVEIKRIMTMIVKGSPIRNKLVVVSRMIVRVI